MSQLECRVSEVLLHSAGAASRGAALLAVLSDIVPAAEIGHPAAGLIELRVNGDIKQRADISQLIHTVPDIIAHLSSFYHLHPGDLIYTGTPEGVGPVVPGDALEGTIAGVGTIALTIGPPE
jgi:fumarylpyruvate hydrolase